MFKTDAVDDHHTAFESGHIVSGRWLSALKYNAATSVELVVDQQTEVIFCPDITSKLVSGQSVIGGDKTQRTIELMIPPEGKIIQRLLSDLPLLCLAVIVKTGPKESETRHRLEPFELRYTWVSGGGSSIGLPTVTAYHYSNLVLVAKQDAILRDKKFFNVPAIIVLIVNIFALFFVPGMVLLANFKRMYV